MSVFNNFRDKYKLEKIWPVSVDQTVSFIAYCFEMGYSPASIVSYIAGLSFYHKLNSWPNPTVQFIVKKVLEGCTSHIGEQIRRVIREHQLQSLF